MSRRCTQRGCANRKKKRRSTRDITSGIACVLLSAVAVCLIVLGGKIALQDVVPFEEQVDSFDLPDEAITAEEQVVVHINQDDDTSDSVHQYSSVADLTNRDDETEPDAKSSPGSRLQGPDKLMYDILCEHIKSVAVGDTRATSIEIPTEDLGLGFHWSASDLGVDAIVDDGLFANGVTERLMEKERVDLQLIADALYHDCPESIYWIDKSESGITSKVNISTAFENGEYVCYQKSIYISFSVTNDTRDRNASDPELSWSAINESKSAQATALEIVRHYADLPDVEKLMSYQKEICALVSYNMDVDASSYGNAWQMNWVFDGDPDTNVVCEGYSKAFQFLCNHTEWNGKVRCYTVSGEITDGYDLSKSPHMWNVLSIDGQNYIADVTNSDTNSIGQDGSLFLTQPTNGNVLAGYDFGRGKNIVHYDYNESTLSLFDLSVIELSFP